MDRLAYLLSLARRALATLDEALAIVQPSSLERDGAIQRFEYCFETVLRLCRCFLREIEGVTEHNPKPVIRKLALASILDEDEVRRGLQLVDDRNLTVHTYIEAVAGRVYQALPEHAALLRAIVERITERIVAGTSPTQET